MDEVVKVCLIAAVAFTATVISTLSGGGSSLITTPCWLMLGYPLPVAVASSTVNGSVWTLVAARNYLKGHDIDWQLVAGLVITGLMGAFAGTQVVVLCDPHRIERIIGGIIIFLVALTYWRRDFGIEPAPPKMSKLLTSLAGLPLGFYEAFFGSGNGIFTSAVLTSARGLVVLRALGYYYVLAFVWCVFAASVYIRGGHWNLTLMVPSAFGGLLGAAVGSSIGSRKGARFVKSLFIVVGLVLGIKLLL